MSKPDTHLTGCINPSRCWGIHPVCYISKASKPGESSALGEVAP